ncbi:MAG: histidinol-phosphate transaminase [Dehalogenimonas sp.]|uniref:Histidinol-phosphate transaminase n=1 Tax=Candidatus Dehalogenimonas loeffleri TaxID=3127115 RepID=A0ABZ2J6C8_9CHLR|nr:histidinol-phosphate transaminase [Dehalogenimonas sp.]
MLLLLSAKPNISVLRRCYHGGPDFAELERLKIKPEDVLDFSSNSNPYPFNLNFNLNDVVIDHYPDSNSTELRRLIAARNKLTEDNVVVGAGSMEIIRLIAQAYLGPGNKALILKPTFGEYETACQIAGAEIIEYWAEESTQFKFDSARCGAIAIQLKPKVVFICNPNNPTGQYLSGAEIEAIIDGVGTDGLVVIDEAYIAFTRDSWDSAELLTRHHNLVIIRSMTKDFALAGLRLGYGLGNSEIIENLDKVKPPWNVNAVAQKAGLQALNDGAYIQRSERQIRLNRDYLLSEIKALGHKTLSSCTNFFLVKVGKAAQFRARLLQNGIIVRDCTSFGLSEYVRIAPRTMPECRKLVNALQAPVSKC